MKPLNDYRGVAVRLTAERLAHILGHPEMFDMLPAMERALAAPELVVRSRTDATVLLSYQFLRKTRLGDKWLCVVVKYVAEDVFVLTAYLTDRPKKGEQVWPIE